MRYCHAFNNGVDWTSSHQTTFSSDLLAHSWNFPGREIPSQFFLQDPPLLMWVDPFSPGLDWEPSTHFFSSQTVMNPPGKVVPCPQGVTLLSPLGGASGDNAYRDLIGLRRHCGELVRLGKGTSESLYAGATSSNFSCSFWLQGNHLPLACLSSSNALSPVPFFGYLHLLHLRAWEKLWDSVLQKSKSLHTWQISKQKPREVTWHPVGGTGPTSLTLIHSALSTRVLDRTVSLGKQIHEAGISFFFFNIYCL